MFRADRGDAGVRLDRVLQRHLADRPAASRHAIQGWIGSGLVAVNGAAAARPALRLRLGDEVALELPPLPPRRAHPAQELPLAVLHEDDHLLVIDKPAGLVVHPTAGHPEGTLWNALLFRARLWPPGAGRRPSLVHRLDRGTSGVLLVAKSAAVHAALARALRAPSAEKSYLALVHGRARLARGRVALKVGVDPADRRRRLASSTSGRDALTLYERLAESPRGPLSLLACRLKTGRTHQIRVHLAALGLPLVGDRVYGEPRHIAGLLRALADADLAARCRDLPRPALHAWRLAFRHPATREPVAFEAPLPPDLADLFAAAGLPASSALPLRTAPGLLLL
ncbi:MAG TPA: RluA family pseudouridine synthase [Thermoanaerobaculia bacterium]